MNEFKYVENKNWSNKNIDYLESELEWGYRPINLGKLLEKLYGKIKIHTGINPFDILISFEGIHEILVKTKKTPKEKINDLVNELEPENIEKAIKLLETLK